MAGPSFRYRNYLVRLTGGDGGALRAQACHRQQWHSPYDVSLPPEYFLPERLDELVSRDPREVGVTLFRALFDGDGGRFRAALARLDNRPRRGIRLRLSFDLTHPTVARAARLPWELLYDPYREDFLGQDSRTPVVRFLERGDAAEQAQALTPLSVLVIHAEPSGCEPLGMEEEIAALTEALDDPDIEVRTARARTWDELREHLLESDIECDVVHFIGHGDLDLGEDGAGGLWFEGTRGRPQVVTGKELGAILRRRPTIRLVVLNACHTAAQPTGDDADPYAGVATALIGAGVPAVIAMSRPIADAAARQFSRTFYRALARREPVEVATARARVALQNARFGPDVWAVPTLFLQALDGDLFDLRPPNRWRAAWRKSRSWVRERPKTVAAMLLILALLGARGTVSPYTMYSLLPNPPECPSPEGFGIPMVYIQPGLSIDPFCLARFETTREQYARIFPDRLDPNPELGSALPVQGISRNEAEEFVVGLNEALGEPRFRLPTRSEWLTAARAGTETLYFFGDDPDRMDDFGNCDSEEPVAVGSFEPNAYELYDMAGNVSEWVYETAVSEDGKVRGKRMGGSWDTVLGSCTSDSDSDILTDRDMADAGFRLAMDPAPARP